MKLEIMLQENYSRLELLARTFFGYIYIGIPHFFLMFFYALYVIVLQIYAWFMILFTQKYPRNAFDALVKLQRWSLRISASLSNLVDGYPPFGPNADWDKVTYEVGYPTVVTRKRLLFASFLSWFVLIPHFIVLYFMSLAVYFIVIGAFFVVLITGNYPDSLHKFMVGFLRYSQRVSLYSSYLYFQYPEFSLDETEADRAHLS